MKKFRFLAAFLKGLFALLCVGVFARGQFFNAGTRSGEINLKTAASEVLGSATQIQTSYAEIEVGYTSQDNSTLGPDTTDLGIDDTNPTGAAGSTP